MTPGQETKLNIATTWIPLTLVATMVIGAFYGAWALSQERAQIYGQINQVSADVKSLANTVEKLTETIAKPNSLAFSRQDFIMDCLRFQIANPSWKCPYAAPSSEHMKTLQ